MAQNKITITGTTPNYDVRKGYEWLIIPSASGNVLLSLNNLVLGAVNGVFYQNATGSRTLTVNGHLIPVNPTANSVTWWAFGWDGTTALVTSNYYAGGGGTVVTDTTAPTVVSATAINATTIRIVFSEAVTATNVGWSFKKNGSAHNPTAVSGSGSNTLDFTVPSMLTGDNIVRSYNGTTGNTVDAAGNELADFTDAIVTNSVGNTTPAAPTAGVVDDVNNTFNWTYNPNYGSNTEYEYTINGGTSYSNVTAKPQPIGDVALAAGQVGVRVKADTGRNASATLYSTAPFTTGVAANWEHLVWAQLQNATNNGNGTLTFSGTQPTGGTATKKLTKANGNYIEYVIPATIAQTDFSVLGLSSVNNAGYGWEPGNIVAATYFNSGGNPAGQYAYNSAGTNTKYAAPVAGAVYRLEIANTNDVLLKHNGTTIHTFSGALNGVTDIYIKGLNAVGGNYHLLNVRGEGLVTI